MKDLYEYSTPELVRMLGERFKEYRMRCDLIQKEVSELSKEIKEYYTNEVAKTYFGNYEGKQLILPSLYLPSKKLLEKHRSLMIG